MNYDKILSNIIYKDNKKTKYWYKILRHNKYDNVYDYILNRYDDSESIDESLYRIMHNINIRPVCHICRNHITYEPRTMSFRKYCSAKCRQQDPEFKQKLKDININKHNDPNFNNRDKAKLTCIEKYGCDNVHKNDDIKRKTLLTNIDRYNGPAPICSIDVKNKMEQDMLRKVWYKKLA